MSAAPVTAIISDLGNVVIDYSFDRVFASWGRAYQRDPEEIKRRFVFGEQFERVERGDIANEAYIAHVGKLLGIEFSRQGFEAGWGDIYIGLKPGVVDLLSSYRTRCRLVALTNTNPLHEASWKARFGPVLHALFEHIFTSDKIRTRKPEPRAYWIVLEYLGLGPGQVVFLDDNPVFIRGAESLGIRSLLVSSRDEIEFGLRSVLGS